MSNEKMAATFHGVDPEIRERYLTDAAVRLAIETAELRGYACGMGDGKYHARPTVEDWAAARRWREQYGFRSQLRPETTGEHTKTKLADDPYAAEEQPVRRPWSPTHRELVIAAFIGCLIIGVAGWIFQAF